jgi:predicted glycoside hydrolase/deacetylase ChbG (UPF0249 family)
MTRYLIVNSDDFGMSAGVNRGILEGHHRGIVTSTTVMINMPDAEAGIHEALRSAPQLGLGLHFTLSFGRPVSPNVPSLVTAEGRFVSNYDELMHRIASFEAADLEHELTAQFQRFVAIAGRAPDHLDSHHGSTYVHPAAFEVMLRLAQEHRLPIRWHGSMDLSHLPTNADGKLEAKLQTIIEKYGLPRKTDHFVNLIFDFGSRERASSLKAGLPLLKAGISELMVHVGYAEGLDEAYTFQREQELAAVTDPAIRALVQSEGIQLITFADLPA